VTRGQGYEWIRELGTGIRGPRDEEAEIVLREHRKIVRFSR